MRIMNGEFPKAIVGLGIAGNVHGVRKGWFWWPINFDPVWLLSCEGMTRKNKEIEEPPSWPQEERLTETDERHIEVDDGPET